MANEKQIENLVGLLDGYAEKRRTEKCQTASSLSGVYKLKSEAACAVLLVSQL